MGNTHKSNCCILYTQCTNKEFDKFRMFYKNSIYVDFTHLYSNGYFDSMPFTHEQNSACVIRFNTLTEVCELMATFNRPFIINNHNGKYRFNFVYCSNLPQ